jgi:hypothetical protein
MKILLNEYLFMRGIMNIFAHINTKLHIQHFAQHFQDNGHSFGPIEQTMDTLYTTSKKGNS